MQLDRGHMGSTRENDTERTRGRTAGNVVIDEGNIPADISSASRERSDPYKAASRMQAPVRSGGVLHRLV